MNANQFTMPEKASDPLRSECIKQLQAKMKTKEYFDNDIETLLEPYKGITKTDASIFSFFIFTTCSGKLHLLKINDKFRESLTPLIHDIFGRINSKVRVYSMEEGEMFDVNKLSKNISHIVFTNSDLMGSQNLVLNSI